MTNNHPINTVKWRSPNELKPNNYNPNVVLTAELLLLLENIRHYGWIFPISVTSDDIIIDGFHRWNLATLNPDIQVDGKVPTVTVIGSYEDNKILTIAINRAKGSHMGYKLHEIVTSLQEEGMQFQEIQKRLGMSKEELQLLLQENVFKKLDVANKPYSRAWNPKVER